MTVGSTFWIHGEFEKWPGLKYRADHTNLAGDDGMPCQALSIIDSEATCLIQLNYGIEAKPEVCRDHPEDELCQHEKLFE